MHQSRDKMAPDGGSQESLLQNNDVYSLVDDRIKHILCQAGSVSQDTLVDMLIEDEDDDLMTETREIIFKQAMSKFSCLIRQAKGMIPDLSKIEMKQRKGDNKLKSYAKDIVHIFVWYVELVSDFPKDVIKGEMTYIDAIPAGTPQGAPAKQHPVGHPVQFPVQLSISEAFGNMNSMQKPKSLSDKSDDCIVDENFNGAQNPCRCPQYADLLGKFHQALADGETREREVTNLRSHLLSIEKILYDEILSVRSISESNTTKIEQMLSVSRSQPKQQQHSQQPPGVNQAIRHNSSDSTTGKPSQQSQPASSSEQDSQSSDPSYTQLMMGIDTQAASGSQTQAESKEPADSVTSSESEVKTPPQPPPKLNKATSPGLVGFVDSTSNRSCIKNKSQSDSDIRKPSMRPKQEKVKDMQRFSSSSDQSDNDGFTEVKYKKRKDRNKAKPTLGLQGRKQESFEELYLSNIAKRDDQSHKDVADEIRDYCKKQKLRVMSVWVVPNRVTDDTVGCKLRVPLRQVDDMLDGRMWPDDISCKRWRKKSPPPSDEPPEQYDRSRPKYRNSFGPTTGPTRRSSSSYNRGAIASRSPGRSRSGSRHSRRPDRRSNGSNSRSRSRNGRKTDWFDRK